MRILVTGGSGFLGRNLLTRLASENVELICYDKFHAAFLDELGVRFIEGDLCNINSLEGALDGVDAVVHMACSVLPKTSNDNPQLDVVSNVVGSINLLDAAVRKSVKKFVFISSGGAIYGVPQMPVITENHPTEPICSYGITKLAIEKYLRLYGRRYKIQTCSIRLANPYGEYQRYISSQGVVPVFCYKALIGEVIDVWGDGSVRRDFIYVQDAVDGIIAAIMLNDTPYEVNIGSGVGTSINELLKVIEGVIGFSPQCRYLSCRDFDVPSNVLDVTMAKKYLNWIPKTNLREGILKTINWIRSQSK